MPDEASHTQQPRPVFLPKDRLGDLVRVLCGEGYTVMGPVIEEGVVMLRPITDVSQMARGVRDEQEGGRYRLVEGDPGLYFEYVVGPDSPKRLFFPPQQRLFTLHIEGERFVMDKGQPQAPKLAIIGARGCELAAIKVQDRVFGVDDRQQTFRCESDLYYQESRRQSFIVAVNCTRAAGTCFCTSWDTGPKAKEGYDLALTELMKGFVLRVGSEKGRLIAEKLPTTGVSGEELELEELKLREAAQQMGRRLETQGVKQLLDGAIDHPRWDEVAQRCLSCGNCTMVCPTCFCSTVTDSNDLATGQVTRTREWESCFTHEFSYLVHQGPSRVSTKAQYRHWLRHKLCTWWEQFETSGCTGCGRCITWCPVGIDLTEEIRAIRDTTPSQGHGGSTDTRPGPA